MSKGLSIAIDGPVAAGKGTIAPVLAQKLNGIYLDTGAMYRCVALYCLENNIDLDNLEQVEMALQKIDIDITRDKVFLNAKDVTNDIRAKEVDLGVPKAAGIAKVREALILQQKKIAEKALSEGYTFVAEGRDIATKVIPNADLKIFLTANVRVRAQRRLKQKEGRSEKQNFEKVLEGVIERDEQDIEVNKTLVKNPGEFGYIILDNSNMSEEETVNFILQKIEVLNDKN
ncbi:MAG: (d)CMP kinase [Patescibacteria group bacterium]|nr:(d)CMP kinase [Patescibacteria group bacterium]